MTIHDELFETIGALVLRHSPSGVEGEIDGYLMKRFAGLNLVATRDQAGNLVVKIPGSGGGKLAITAHKDEIGAIVTAVESDGRLKVQNVGGSFPWVYGEGVVDVLGDGACISGVLSFGSRHVSHASPQFAFKESAPIRWQDAWVETKLATSELTQAGVRQGSRVVVGKHRKAPFRLGNHIASYTLDNKASLAILLELARRIKDPYPDVYLVASAKEEVGAVGALYFTRQESLDALIALEICPIAPEYSIKDGDAPVLLAQDAFGLYDDSLLAVLRTSAERRGIPVQVALINGFGSDGSISMKYGHVPKGACLGFPTQNTHGYEIAHLGAIANCIDILEGVCQDGIARGTRSEKEAEPQSR